MTHYANGSVVKIIACKSDLIDWAIPSFMKGYIGVVTSFDGFCYMCTIWTMNDEKYDLGIPYNFLDKVVEMYF